jgi:hypothetical protein
MKRLYTIGFSQQIGHCLLTKLRLLYIFQALRFVVHLVSIDSKDQFKFVKTLLSSTTVLITNSSNVILQPNKIYRLSYCLKR